VSFIRVAVASPRCAVGDVDGNVEATAAAIRTAHHNGAALVVLPELGLTGYSAGDLFHSELLLSEAVDALHTLNDSIAALPGVAAVVGLPWRTDDHRVYNVAAVVSGGHIVGIVPKQYLPNRHEFYEDRWFTRALGRVLPEATDGIPFGTDLVFVLQGYPGAALGIEICEDLWAVEPPSGRLALAGASLIANPSGSPELLGKSEYRRDLVRQQSARCLAAYLYAGAGPGESTMDVVFGGHCLIAENGTMLAETERFSFETQVVLADVDLERLVHERHDNSSFAAAAVPAVRRLPVDLTLRDSPSHRTLERWVDPHPFVPDDVERRAHHCGEIFSIQATGLAKRLLHTGAQRVVIGVSGGLDSTLALLVAVRAFDSLEMPRNGIVAVTMPGFGTTGRTRDNAVGLVESLGASLREIPIGPAVLQHFNDIGHDEARHDVVYENAQARERTQILMDVANQVSGFVVGTGDLSEAALGWLTFNGDHMSMYHVNIGVPKTLVRYLVSWVADSVFGGRTSAILHDIVATPITPELLPLHEGELVQLTEVTVGPYELHDFFLYHVVRFGSRPSRVFHLACQAFQGTYQPSEIVAWLEVFLRRFFASQFKRSAMPDGPKVGSVALSPRGDWRMPSDASAAVWLDEVRALMVEAQ
jgi:NAD+ synthase (glutamine-hydrolysing)